MKLVRHGETIEVIFERCHEKAHVVTQQDHPLNLTAWGPLSCIVPRLLADTLDARSLFTLHFLAGAKAQRKDHRMHAIPLNMLEGGRSPNFVIYNYYTTDT